MHLSNMCRPETDCSPELNEADASHCHSLSGVLRWIVELGRVDICLKVLMMASHLALPRQGHLNEAFHVFAHLKGWHHAEMVFDPSPVEFDGSAFKVEDWTCSQHGCEDLKEILPEDMPVPRGPGMTIRVCEDSDMAGCEIARWSRTGFTVF